MASLVTRVGLSALAVAYSSAAAAQTPTLALAGVSQPALSGSTPEKTRTATIGSDAPAAAQTNASVGTNALGEIVVTAQKRSESLQRVPIAITAVTAADLARSGIRDLQGIVAIVPNLSLGQQLGVAKITLRGIGLENIAAGAEGSIAFHVDGVFESRSIAALSSFYDVEQVEVLRGPQGTLYGRNATGGSINITTRAPKEELSGYANLTAGNFGRYASDGAITGAIVPGVLLARLAFQTDNHDGYGKNIITGNAIDDLNTRSIRGKLLFTPTHRLSFEVTGDYHYEQDSGGGYHYLDSAGFSAPGIPVTPTGLLAGGKIAPNIRDIANDQDPRNHVDFGGVSGKLTWDLGGNTQFRSLTAFRRTNYSTTTDLDSTSAPLTLTTQFERDKQFSQEFQLSGKNHRLTWLVGLFYFHENDLGGQPIPFNNLTVGFPAPGTFVQGFFAGGTIKTDALAAFGQVSYEVVDRLRLTIGGRYSTEKKRDHDDFSFDALTPYNPGIPLKLISRDDSKRFKSFTPRIALDYQATPDLLLYASWSKGFKAGTYNLGALQAPVNPEKVSAFEGGMKSTFFDHHLRLNLAGFYYDYEDLQVGKVIQNVLSLENAATATIYGVEAELQAKLNSRVDFNANASWLHARFDKYISADPARPFGDGTIDPASGGPAFNLAGNSLSQSPNFTFFIGGQYHLPTHAGTFTLRGEVAWRDRVYYTPFNRNYVGQEPNAKVNAFVNWLPPGEQWNASLFVKNITNKTTIGNSYVSSSLVGFPINGYLEEPRTFGATIGYKF